MADSATEQTVPEVPITDGNATAKIPATPEGMAIAYGSLFLMAIVPIFIGSFRSVTYHKEQKVSICLVLFWLFCFRMEAWLKEACVPI